MSGQFITVFGASGFIGRYVVRALCARGLRVRAATRRPHLANDLRVLGTPGQVQLVQANIRNPDSVARAVEGARGVVNLVGVAFESGRQRFFAVHAQGAANIAEAARDAAAGRLVHVSAIADATSGSRYARSKALGEARVREAFPAATILRPSVVFGVEDQFFNKFAALFEATPAFLPVPVLIHGGKTRMQPIYVRDVAEAVARALEQADATGRTYELGGPRVYTFKELLRFTMETTDRRRLLMPVHGPFADLLGLAGSLVGALPFVKPPITLDQVRQLRRDTVATAGEGVGLIEDLGIDHTDTVEAIVPEYLERYRKYGQFHESRFA
jgi:NADH dehydrogenase